ncbi:MAG: ABC transporter permease [Rhodospirillales bacterium]|nr:ABC transporter permease [Rhodospirillales bacterium]
MTAPDIVPDIPESTTNRRRRRLLVIVAFFRALPTMAKIGAAIVAVAIAVSVFSPALITHDPTEQSLIDRNQSFSAEHWFGTDRFGRDVYSRLVMGARYTLGLTVTSLLIAASIGTLIGLGAAYNRGGAFDSLVVWFVDIFMTFPTLILGVIIVAIFGQGLFNVGLAITIAFLPRIVRMARGVGMNVVGNEYVEAARAIGASTPRIIVIHLLPNILSEMAVISTLWLGTAIQVETNLSFLGLGVQPPMPSWGLMIREGLEELYINPWPSLLPVLAILITVIGLNMLADGSQDVLNPTTRER